ncbi:glutathione peroxidase 2-like [Ptychodera flava]|uniref:glutathione peroxidase 2-like n=1 Tax=Ptychodera flava TaxID=63121 RepID=UPI00396A500C
MMSRGEKFSRSPVIPLKLQRSYTYNSFGAVALSAKTSDASELIPNHLSTRGSTQRPSTVHVSDAENGYTATRGMDPANSLPGLNSTHKRQGSVADGKRRVSEQSRKRSMPGIFKPIALSLPPSASIMDSRDFERNEKLVPVSMVKSFFELSAQLINGDMLPFAKFEGKVVLVTNIATSDKNTTRELFQLNDLVMNYFSKGLVVLAFPCEQFGGKVSWDNDEIAQCLKFVRPGRNFEPRFHVMAKCDVNGDRTHPVFEYLKQRLPLPTDDVATFAKDPRDITWRPVLRSDITWNFEKFIIGIDGTPLKRFTAKTKAALLTSEIEPLLKKIPRRGESRRDRNYDFSYKERQPKVGSVLGVPSYTMGQWGS